MQPSDLNSDGVVDVIDLSILVSRWGSSDATADINGDGVVDALDLSVLVSNWGPVSGDVNIEWHIVAASDASAAEKADADVVCDGTNDQVEIAAALNNFENVMLSTGTFSIDSALSISNRSGRRFVGQGMDATVLEINNSSTGLSFQGTLHIHTDPYQAFAEGANTITTKTDFSSLLSPGDYFATRTDEIWNPLRSPYTVGQWFQVASITPTTITVTEPAWLAHQAGSGSRLYRFDLIDGLIIEDMTVRQMQSTRQVLVQASQAKNVTFRRVRAEGINASHKGLEADRCVDVLFEDCESRDIVDSTRISGTQGYGAYFYAVWRGEMRRHSSLRDRHGVDVDGGNYRPLSHETKFVECVSTDNWSAGISTHGGAFIHESIDCAAYNCGGGHIYRGSHNTITRPYSRGSRHETAPTGKIENYGSSLRIGEGGSDNRGPAGTELSISDPDLDYAPWTGYRISSIHIDDPVVNGSITGGILRNYRTTDYGINFANNANITGLTIDNIYISNENDAGINQVRLGSGSQSGVSVTNITP
jgi:hypothetical protein